MKIAIVGAGFTGLTAAYYLSKGGHEVVIFEKEACAGGLAAGFKENNWQWSLEYFFHHLFTSDTQVRELITELGLSQKLFYRRAKTSIFYQGTISQFDSPGSLLRFPCLSFGDRLRAGLVTFGLKTLPFSQSFEKITASSWLTRFYGQKAYAVLWQPLLESKFGDKSDKISLAWFYARIKKRSTKLGYLEGGFQVLIDKLVEEIKRAGGEIRLNYPIKGRVSPENLSVDKVLFATPPLPFLPIDKELPEMRGALSLVLVLKKPFLTDGTYWLNINEKGFPFVAVVEHTNFIDQKYYGGSHVLYVGGYYPQNHKFFQMTKEEIFEIFQPYLKKINSGFNMLYVICYMLQVNRFAQPIIPINYSKIIPPMKTSFPNVFLANMQMIHPWDRGVNYAIELGKKAAAVILACPE